MNAHYQKHNEWHKNCVPVAVCYGTKRLLNI